MELTRNRSLDLNDGIRIPLAGDLNDRTAETQES
jgi:hypothetical protein